MRGAKAVVWTSWPAGFVLIAAHTLGGILGRWAFVLLALGYAVALGLALRGLGRKTHDGGTARLLVVGGPMIFVLAGLTRPPTAAAPGPMLLNAAVLAVAAAVLVVAATRQVLDRARLDRVAALGLLALLVGSAGWMVNLVARWAVVLAGGSGLQLDVEASAWMANVYLRGLPGEPSFMAYLLVLMDLLQIVYVVLTYVAFGLIARSATRDGLVAGRTGRWISTVALGLAGVVLLCAAAAAWLGPIGVVPAWAAFVLTIPFMTTLVPALLGAAMLTTTGPLNVDAARAPEAAWLAGRGSSAA